MQMQFDGYEDTSHMFKLDIRNEKNDIFFIFITANNLL